MTEIFDASHTMKLATLFVLATDGAQAVTRAAIVQRMVSADGVKAEDFDETFDSSTLNRSRLHQYITEMVPFVIHDFRKNVQQVDQNETDGVTQIRFSGIESIRNICRNIQVNTLKERRIVDVVDGHHVVIMEHVSSGGCPFHV